MVQRQSVMEPFPVWCDYDSVVKSDEGESLKRVNFNERMVFTRKMPPSCHYLWEGSGVPVHSLWAVRHNALVELAESSVFVERGRSSFGTRKSWFETTQTEKKGRLPTNDASHAWANCVAAMSPAMSFSYNDFVVLALRGLGNFG